MRFPLDSSAPQSLALLREQSATFALRSDGTIALAPVVRVGEFFETPAIEFIDRDAAVLGRIERPHPSIDMVGQIRPEGVSALTFSADDSLLLTRFGGKIRLWREAEVGGESAWRPVANLDMGELVTDAVLSPSSRLLAVHLREEIVLFSVADSGEHLTLAEAARLAVAPNSSVGSVRFNLDETLLAISTAADTVQIWGVTK
ncbi:MAG: hypothetical protein IPK19_38380 [Chloroflexi bacterium]|nr:hypothetical protein [Chloroflexota bacterium]